MKLQRLCSMENFLRTGIHLHSYETNVSTDITLRTVMTRVTVFIPADAQEAGAI